MKCPVALYDILILYFWKVNIFVCRGAPGSGAFVMQDRQGDVARPLSKPLGYVFDGNFALWGAL